MLEKDTILSLMTTHFPRWTDIRKRVNSSNGGKLLHSIAEETANIQSAIDDYKKDFFLVNYLDKYEDIPYYIYYISVGSISTSNLTIVIPEGLSEASSAKDFYNTDKSYYYDEDKICFKSDDISETSAQVRYIYDGNEYTSIINKLYVWNIYDEFAAFVGIRRFTDEDNESLTKRIINVFQCVSNSTEEGIKNAIINDTLDLIDDVYGSLSFDEIRSKIIIEHPTPDNLAIKYDEVNTILDKLTDINRDVYRAKTWDFDLWQFDLAGIDYIPHMWDYVLSAYANGVGFDDDLKPEVITDTSATSSALISVYKKDYTTISEYLSVHSISKNLKFTLTKYSEDLSSTTVKYTIKASEPVDITSMISDLTLRLNAGNVVTNIKFSNLFDLQDNEVVYLNNITESFIIYNTVTKEYRIKRISFDDSHITEAIGSSDISNAVFSVVTQNSDINTIFVTEYNNVLNYDITNAHVGAFTYVYLTSKIQPIHVAYNSIRTYTNKTSNVEISNNFSPIVQLSKFLVFTIQSSSRDCIVNFSNNKVDEYIGSWSLGNSTIDIESNINYNNIDYSKIVFSGVFETNSPSIYLSDIFTQENLNRYVLSNEHDIDLSDFDITEYEVTPETDNIRLVYSDCDKSTSDLTENDINKYVRSIIANDVIDFIKLPNVNIDDILYIGTDYSWYPGKVPTGQINSNTYSLINDKGVISFTQSYDSLLIVYKLRIPEYVTISIDELYKLTEYSISAYSNIGNVTLHDATDGYVFDLNSIDGYDSSCNVVVSRHSNNYIPSIINDTVVFTKVPENVMSVKYGYYYFGNQEYYLLLNQEPTTDQTILNTDFNNTYIKDSSIILNKRSTNNIKNSAMTLNSISNTYYVNAVDNTGVISYNHLGSLSTCDNFNKWITFGATLSPYVYDKQLGIKITPHVTNGYTYLNITNSEAGDYFLSLSYIGSIRAYIAKEIEYDDMKFAQSLNTEIAYELRSDGGSVLSTYYTQEADKQYYLVIAGDGVFDNIMLIDADKTNYVSSKKNIDILGFNVQEQINDSGYSVRLYMDSKNASYSNAEIDEDGYAITSTNVNWGMTPLLEYNSYDDFVSGITLRSKVNIDNDYGYLYTLADSVGSIESAPIRIDNIDIIKNLIIEINDIPFPNMTGFQTQLLVSNTENGVYTYIDDISYTNISSFDCSKIIGNYIKIHVFMPPNTIINNITLYAEYKTTDIDQPIGTVYTHGIVYSHILDTYIKADYKINSIDLDYIGSVNDFNIRLRGFVEDSVWTDWKELSLDAEGNVLTDVEFINSRYIQAMIELRSENVMVKINHIDIRKVN